jgi:hypothetical protein
MGGPRRVLTPVAVARAGSPCPTLSLMATSQPGVWCGQRTARDVPEWQNGVPGENCQGKTIVCGLVKSVLYLNGPRRAMQRGGSQARNGDKRQRRCRGSASR